MRLYEISQEILDCVDYETGEVDSERMAFWLGAEEAKLEGIGKYMKCLKAEYTDLDEEEKVLRARKNSVAKALDGVARFVGAYLGGEKRTVGSVKFMFLGKQEGKLNLLVPARELPEEYRTESISYRENGTAIRDALHKGVDLDRYVKLDPRPKASVK